MRKPLAGRMTAGLVAAIFLGTLLAAGRTPALPRDDAGEAGGASRKILKNGLTLITERDASTATTVIQILIRGGKRAQPAGEEGLAFLATRLAVEIPDENKIQDLVGMASRFQVTVSGDYSVIQLECLSEELAPTLKIMAKIVGDPLFSGLRIDSVKKHAEHQGRIEEDDSVTVGHLSALRAFSGAPGYGGSIYGDRQTLAAIKGKDISGFYERYFVAPNMVLAVSSDRQDAGEVVESAFGGLSAAAAPPPGRAALRAPAEGEIILMRDTRQAFISRAFLLPQLGPRSFALNLLLESVLGKGPGSWLWPLRAERKLAYHVNAAATQMTDWGILEAYLETDKSKSREALEALKGVLSDIREAGVTEADLRSARTSVWADFLRGNETRVGRTLNLATLEAQGLGLGFYDGLRTELEAVTIEEFNAFAKKILAPENSVTIVVGPEAETRPGQSSP